MQGLVPVVVEAGGGDGYAGYDALGDPKKTNQPWGITYCWTHWRRRFVEYSRTTSSPICTEMKERIGQLYRIVAEIRSNDPNVRCAIREKLSKPIVDALRPWLEAQLEMLSPISDRTRHIKYGLKRWNGLTRFLDDGRASSHAKVCARHRLTGSSPKGLSSPCADMRPAWPDPMPG